MSDFKVKDQVVVRRRTNRSGPTTNEIRVGSIIELAASNATISLPKPGGQTERVTVPLSSLEHVKQCFGRSAVRIDPTHRQIGRPA